MSVGDGGGGGGLGKRVVAAEPWSFAGRSFFSRLRVGVPVWWVLNYWRSVPSGFVFDDV